MSQQSGTLYDVPNRPPTGPNRQARRHAPKILSKEDLELLQMCKDWFSDSRRARLPYERQWYLNLAFYAGKQYVQWTSKAVAAGLSRLYEPPVPPWRVRLVSNKVRPYIRKEIAKLIKEKPQPFVIPASTDDDDLAAARAGEALYEHLTRELQYNAKLRRTLFWASICGSSFMKDWFDPSLRDSEGIEGSVCLEPVSPWQFYVPDPQEEELDHQPYVIHALAKDPSWVEEVYGFAVQPDSQINEGLLEQRFLTAIGVQDAPKRYVAVKECWIKPCKKYPEGAVITWAGDTILSKGIDPDDSKSKPSWPFQTRDYPFTKFDSVPSGSFYGTSIIEDLIPLQKERNRTRSQIVEAKNRMSKPQLTAARGSVDANKITSEPGLIIWYTPGFQPPTSIPLQNLPGYVIEEIQRCDADMDDIAGQHEISKGSAPTGVSAATAISFLQEQDDTMIAPVVTGIEEGTARIGQHLLSHVDQFWEAERTVRALGDNNAYEVYMFNKANLAGNTDLNVQAGSALPRSQAAKQAFIMEMMEKKFISPEQGLRYLNMAETNRMYEELLVSARQAQRENLRMSQMGMEMDGQSGGMDEGQEGLPDLPTNTWDEDEAHIAEHDLYRRRQAFENLPEPVKVVFENHVTQHRQKVALKAGMPIAPHEQNIPTAEQEAQQGGGGNGQVPSEMMQAQLPGMAQGMGQ